MERADSIVNSGNSSFHIPESNRIMKMHERRMKATHRCISFINFTFHFLCLLFGNAWACTSTPNVPRQDCAMCMANQLTLTPGDGTTSTTPTVSGITIDANGCQHIMVTCTALAGGMTFMQFNVNQGGPINPTGTVVTATLDCVNGQWVYQQAGISRVITEVNCQNT